MGSTLLVIEDDPGIRALLRAVLEIRGHSLHEAASGELGVEAARRLGPDAVLLDIGLPGIDGLEVLRQLKEDADLRSIPVIMVTAWDDAERIQRASDLGAADYIRKPFDAMALADRVEALLAA